MDILNGLFLIISPLKSSFNSHIFYENFHFIFWQPARIDLKCLLQRFLPASAFALTSARSILPPSQFFQTEFSLVGCFPSSQVLLNAQETDAILTSVDGFNEATNHEVKDIPNRRGKELRGKMGTVRRDNLLTPELGNFQIKQLLVRLGCWRSTLITVIRIWIHWRAAGSPCTPSSQRRPLLGKQINTDGNSSWRSDLRVMSQTLIFTAPLFLWPRLRPLATVILVWGTTRPKCGLIYLLIPDR